MAESDLNVIDAPETIGKVGFAQAFKNALEIDPDKPAPIVEKKETPEPKKETTKSVIPDSVIKKEVVAEPVKSELDSIPEPKNEGEKKNFTALREKAKAFEAKATELEKRIADFESKGKDTEGLQAKLTELEKTNAEYLEIVTRSNVENHPDFKKQFVEGRQNLVKRAQSIIEESGGDKDAIATALNLRGKARVDALREVAGELDGFQQGRLGTVITELSALDEQADAKISESRKTWEDFQAKDKETATKQNEEFAHKVQSSFETTAKRLGSELEVLAHIEGNDEWNKQADSILKDARAFVETNKDLPTSMEVAILGKTAPIYREAFLAERKQNEALSKQVEDMTKELKGIYSKTPNLNSGGSDKTVPKKGFIAAYNDTMNSATE